MVRDDLRKIIQAEYPGETVVIDYVPAGKKGDYSTNLAMRLASKKNAQAIPIAEEIAARVRNPIIDETVVQAPGFVNFVINRDYLKKKLTESEKLDIGRDTRVNVEFVSANPTGPLNIVSARAAAFGDSLIKLLNAAGFRAEAEYYTNDYGRQADLLAESVIQRINELLGKEAQIPEGGYPGEYLIAVAKEALHEKVDGFDAIKSFSLNYFIQKHKEVLETFGVRFNNWIRESWIRDQGYIEEILKTFKSKNLTFNQDGAVFFKTTEFGDNRDRVIITSDNRYTYLLPDIAYHQNKIERGYQKLITILGPDHHGQVKSLCSGIKALGYHEDILKVIIVQQVKLKKGGEYVTMSKRTGTITTIDELLEKIPKDVARFFFLMRSSSQHLDFNLDLAMKDSEENPVYYVQYAYARIRSILRHAREKGIACVENPDLVPIKEVEEYNLIKHIIKFPEMTEDAVRNLEPYPLTYYLIELARIFHNFYQKHRVVGEDAAVTHARLYLVDKTAEAIKRGLELIGVACPEQM